MDATSIALSGLRSAKARFDEASTNIARISTIGVDSSSIVSATPVDGESVNVRVRVVHPTPDLAESLVSQKAAAYSFIANLQTIRTSDSMTGALLDAVV